MSTFISFDVRDVRFPTSRDLDGSDAMNPDPDYSAAYLTIRTDDPADAEGGTSLVFTIGRGNDVQGAAIRALEHHVIGRDVEEVLADLGGLHRRLNGDSQLRWLGPETGVMAMAVGAVVNAMWDLRARREGRPLWLTLASLEVEEILDLVDFRYLSDALTREEAREILERGAAGRDERIEEIRAHGVPAYTTTPGWLGYSDDKLTYLLHEARDQGFEMVKLKVGGDVEDDVRRLALAREVMGEGYPIAIDANQRWDVDSAVTWLERLAPSDPYWIEEPTFPGDVLAHAAIRRRIAPMRVATGEQGSGRVLFKQLLQAEAIDVLQLDATRVAGINENLAILLLAAKFGVPVCPHAGGVGLCEMVQHLAFLDAVAIGGTNADRRIEFVDHLHERFEVPVRIERGAYMPPEQPGSGARMLPATLAAHAYPDGPVWQQAAPPLGAGSSDASEATDGAGTAAAPVESA
ncbi:fuconate dehydratase [Brachybacterium endophyticum]|uniref:Fuconate dehydratase n=1 Tax=Brachybacterium endophyticum TaxID=2182385 RepID=A0A2U2RN24_9MICO|nr:enolase C-terminal domain-like protein [Brachybacterium endophyticum]PWH07246.1 fuconate dehydratase [Brachybacterium endophyticum]